jgi:phosphocarrier protein FPr
LPNPGSPRARARRFAWKKAITTHADQLAGMRNQLLAQRANDLRDVGLRVLSILTGTEIEQPSTRQQHPDRRRLDASDTAALDRTRVMGFCTTRGGATSHVAILARSVGIPALAGIEPAALELANGTRVILDGHKGHCDCTQRRKK